MNRQFQKLLDAKTIQPLMFFLLISLVVSVAVGDRCTAGEPRDAVHPGYRILRTKAYLPPDFDDTVFDELWKQWPPELRDRAAAATSTQRREMLFNEYGLMPSPDAFGNGKALGYVDGGRGGWVMNCLTCHAGKVAGQVILGLPNSHLALQTLVEDVRATKIQMQKPLSHMDLGSLAMPLGTTNGTTNAVMFGVALEALRDDDLNVHLTNPQPNMLHHDMDAPPWWHLRKKKWIYADGFVAKSHRALMQFMLIPRNDAKTFKSWEEDYRQILAWIETIQPPKYPFEIDDQLAEQGRVVFEATCSECHGTYGEEWTYPERIVDIDELGTDPLRLQSLSPIYRRKYGRGWLADYDPTRVREHPGGYVAPPLDGIWATAPYFHNGSVPTLWHVLHPDQRPAVWRRSIEGYDTKRVGLEVAEFAELPGDVKTPRTARAFFNTQESGKSAAGHRFPETLSESERNAVLEYLKTL